MNEVDVIYLNEKGVFQSRKALQYDTPAKAAKIFVDTIDNFKALDRRALVMLRKLEDKKWTLIKTERV